ncbi:hypothetical protein J7K27_08380 [Candidatus Bathyarchaeota archaeon]|nr:hypothetical protein [Candidatus Bathyarchaeota archaeon]
MVNRSKKKKSDSDLKRVGFYIEEDIWNEFKSLVAKSGRTIRDVIEEEIEKWLEEHGDRNVERKISQDIFEII